ncbi:SpoIIIAH-like family protein [Bacillaceae bacterium S4-13-58]
MLLKKQTVWLLTMLSLMIVLSVYYMMSPSDGQVAFLDQEENNTAENDVANLNEEQEDLTENGDVTEASGDENSVISSITSDELFTAIRMEREDDYNATKERLDDVIASSDVSSEEKNEALNEIDNLEDRKSKESYLEQTIMAQYNYPDVLVRADDDIVHVTVKADELSDETVVEIMQLTRDEFGVMPVDVSFSPSEN